MNKILFWLKNSRLFSLPMSILSWLIIFVYAFNNGNKLNGIVALLGIACAHLATNLFDDYIDYQALDDNCQQCKCAYIKSGNVSIKDVLHVVIIYFLIAGFAGLYLFLKCGLPVIFLALIGAFIALCYARLSKLGLSEIAVGTAFGPLLFEGVYFVMTGNFSVEVFILSIAVVMFTIGLMYVHTILDYEGDEKCNKKTLACRLASKEKAINGIFIVYGLGYIFTVIFAIMSNNYYILATLVLIPLIFDLHKSLSTFKCGEDVEEFYFRLLKARNLMVWYSIIMTISLIVY